MPSEKDQTGEDVLARPMRRREMLRGMLLGGAGIAGLGLAGCGSSGGTVGSKGLAKTIGFSQPDTTAAIWQPLMAGARKAAAQHGYQLLESHANSKLDAQVSEIQTWIGQGVAGIIVLPLDNDAMQPLIKKAHQAGIKFLDYSDNALPNADGWVIFDNEQGARLVGTYAGQWVKKTLGGKAQVALLTHQVQLTGRQRIEGAVKALQAVAPGAQVVAQHEGVLSPDTYPATQSMLEAHPNLDVFICIADEGCDGCLHALLDKHPSTQRKDQTLICGFDGSGPVIKDILSDSPIRVTGALDSVAVGAASINATVAAIEGKGQTHVNFPYDLVDSDTKALGQKLLKEMA